MRTDLRRAGDAFQEQELMAGSLEDRLDRTFPPL